MRNVFQCRCCGGRYFDADLQGNTYHHACPDLPPDRNGVTAPPPDARNENLAPYRFLRMPQIVSEGKGVDCLSNTNLTEPAWITALKRRAAKQEAQES